MPSTGWSPADEAPSKILTTKATHIRKEHHKMQPNEEHRADEHAGEQKKSLAGKALDAARKKGLVDESMAKQAREKGLVDKADGVLDKLKKRFGGK